MDPNFDELLSLVGDLGEKLMRNPRGLEIFQKIKSGEISEVEAVEALFQILKEEGLLGEVLETSQKVQRLLPEASQDLVPVIQSESGESLMNPLWEAAIIERTSLDGDVPELRHGPMPPEGKPAVPVILDGTDPVVAGIMLERASQQIQEKLLTAQKDHEEICVRLLAMTEQKALEAGDNPVLAIEVARKHLPEAPKGVPGYMAGESPAFLSVPVPTGSELLEVSDERAQHYSHKALSTTQGRISLSRPIANALAENLAGLGVCATLGEVKSPLARPQWVVASYGAGDFSPRFNYVNSAIAALSGALEKEISAIGTSKPLIIEVVPYNGISTRTFGWEVRIGEQDV